MERRLSVTVCGLRPIKTQFRSHKFRAVIVRLIRFALWTNVAISLMWDWVGVPHVPTTKCNIISTSAPHLINLTCRYLNIYKDFLIPQGSGTQYRVNRACQYRVNRACLYRVNGACLLVLTELQQHFWSSESQTSQHLMRCMSLLQLIGVTGQRNYFCVLFSK